MASEELARKLQSRLSATQEVETRPVPPRPQEPEAAGGDSSSELSAKLTRRLDINEGNAAPRPTRVFNPYTEFKEFSRKQIKDMETMFKRLGRHACVWWPAAISQKLTSVRR
ncbi:EF-hand domain-containing protein D1-like isoform X2 [Micropterus dolomieu]|uniref:EF-hand domain-containing protein D1-like isoform X2 n=1 Tax=Micropterus dolomieu TaxID=147949 RepID=UPI001E8E0B59|nr:EF-hand domain-containing protein D1-like isoform X2 [Micropterus dolomieu]